MRPADDRVLADDPRSPSTRPRLSLPRKLALFLAALGSGAGLGIALVCLLASAYGLLELALVACALDAALVVALVAPLLRAPARARRIAIGVALAALLRIALALLPSMAAPRPGAPLRSCFVGAPSRPWFAGIPEGDLVSLGVRVGVTPAEYARAGGAAGFRREYEAIARDAPFDDPASPLLDSWLCDRGHFWLCRPEGAGPFPLLVFLHGTGGSFQVYPEWLALAARARGIATAFPTGGFGLWPEPAAAERIAAVVARASREAPIDPRRVFLCGLSAGAPPIYEVAQQSPGAIAGVISLSGVPPARLDPEALRETRVLLLHGVEDERSHVASQRRVAAFLREGGVDVSLVEVPDADHLLLMERRSETVGRILDFMSAVR